MNPELTPENQLTFTSQDDILDMYYKSWEEIPVSTLNFNNKTEQIVYIALSEEEAIKALNTQSLPVTTIAYEYKENINLKSDEVILAVAIETSNMIDTTNIEEFKKAIAANSTITYAKQNNVALIRRVAYKTINCVSVGIIIYTIIDNRAVKAIYKIQ